MSWLERQKLLASDGAAGDCLGYVVAIDGDTAIVGAFCENANTGAAYVFVRSGVIWSEQQKLLASDGVANDYFGYSVAVDGDTIVVGASQEGSGDQGAAYVFTRAAGVWTEQQKLVAGDGVNGDCFGEAVDLSGDTVVVGAPHDDNAKGVSAGAVYVFIRAAGVWSEQQKLLNSNGALGDQFGDAVAVDGETLVGGAHLHDGGGGALTSSGSAYVFVRTAGIWAEQQELIASDTALGDFFGYSVSISADTIVSGAPYEDNVGGNNAGSAYIFTRSGVVWTEQQKILASDGAASSYFGDSSSVDGDSIAIGAYWDTNVGGIQAGAAYVFARAAGLWSEQQKLLASDGAAGDNFGCGVAIDGDVVVAGALFDDNAGGANAGAAYIWQNPKRITAPTGAFYVDNLEYINPADRGAVINCIPGGGETDVAKDVAIYLHLVSFENAALGGDARVYITPSSTGVQTLAYDQGAGGFQAGFSGIATVRQSPGAVVDDELVLVFQRSTSFASLETVLLEVYGSVQGFGSFSSTYGFTIEDYTAPSIFEVLWLTPKKVRVKFSEDMEMGTDPDSALFYRNYNGGVELIAPNKIKLQGAELSSLWSSLRVGVAGSAYPQNNGYHEIASVDTTNSELTVSSAILDDDGIDLNEAGIIADRRTLIAVVSPYVLSPRLSDEGATDPPQSASRIQCAYCPIVVATSQPAAEELPSGASLLQYVYLDLHDDISRSRLYRLAGYGAQDVWDNAMSGEYLDFQAPSFQLPSNRVGLWSVGIIPGSDQEEDLGDEGQLRRMAVVLQDVLDLLWHKAYQVQFVEDPFRCPARLLDYLLYDLGNPFRFPLETELIKRKLAAALHGFYQKVGTKQGIKNMIFTLLGMQITIQAYVTEGGWLLGDATYGLLGDTTYLGPSGTFAKNCYEILTPRVITAAELRIIRDVATWADPPNMHLVRIIENVAGGTEYDTTDLDLSAGNVSP